MPWQPGAVQAPEIPAGRLLLRAFRPSDAAAVHASCQDAEIQRWTRVPVPYAEQDAVTYVEQLCPAEWAGATGAPFAVVDRGSGRLLASVGLHGISAQDHVAEIGFWCAAGARGSGVVTQAVGVVCSWGFAELGLRRVEWLAQVGNTASRRVAERAGFVMEGVARARLDARGRQVDSWVAALLPDDVRPGDVRPGALPPPG